MVHSFLSIASSDKLQCNLFIPVCEPNVAYLGASAGTWESKANAMTMTTAPKINSDSHKHSTSYSWKNYNKNQQKENNENPNNEKRMNIDSDRLNTLLILLVETIRTTRPMTLSTQQELVTEE